MTDTQTIKDRLDIVQVIQKYLPLKKAGANWKAPCPFHREKSPSFMVHPEKQIWHCFGCGKGGDVFSFVQEIEGLEFPEVLKLLADRAGVKLENSFQNEVQKSQKNRIMEINAKAAYFFHRLLMDMPGAKRAREYLDGRKLKKETIETWQIGYVPDQWDLLTKYLLKKGFGIDDLIAAGLTIKREGADAQTGRGFYDRFRGRIMFPLADAHGNIVGFTGRILVETENSGGKYVNTPQTLVYDKSRVLFGLDKAKTQIKAKDLAVIVEGQMDVIACHQAGMNNVIAASGTALTPEQVKIIKRYSGNIAMAFDADAAGQNAAKRGIDVAMEEGADVRVINIPEGAGKDADECIKKNPSVWFDSVAHAKGVMDWHFESVLGKKSLKSPAEQKAAAALLSEIIKIPYAVERDGWVSKLAEELSIDPSVMREELKKFLNKKPLKMANTKDKEAPPAAPAKKIINASSTAGRYELLITRLILIWLKYPKLFSGSFPETKADFFSETSHAGLYETLQKQYNTTGGFDKVELAAAYGGEKENPIDLLSMQAEKDFLDYSEDAVKKELNLLISTIKELWKKIRRNQLGTDLKKAQTSGNRAELEGIMRQVMELDQLS